MSEEPVIETTQSVPTAEHWAQITEARAELAIREREYSDALLAKEKATKTAKAAEAKYDEAQRAMRDAVDNKGQMRLALGDDEGAWRDVQTSELDLPDILAQKLVDMNLLTMGDIADWRNDGHEWEEIPGVGEGKAQRLDEAVEAFFEYHGIVNQAEEEEGEA